MLRLHASLLSTPSLMAETQYETGWSYDSDNRSWRPPPTPMSGFHQHTLVDLYGAGTFPNGNYFFPGELTAWTSVRGWVAKIGKMDTYGDFAAFGHINMFNVAGQYCLLQEGDGTTYLNSAQNKNIYFRIYNSTRLYIGPTISEWSEGIVSVFKAEQQGNWDASVMRIVASGGSTSARIAFWSQGQGSAPIWKDWGTAFEGRSWDDAGWAVIRGDTEDYSSLKAKKNIQDATARLPKAERKEKIKRLRTAHFNRRRGGCANCMGTGLRKHNRVIHPDQDKVKDSTDTTPCPTCDGAGMEYMLPDQVMSEQDGWFGFISEEVVQEFPEAVYYRLTDDGTGAEVSGLSVQALVAVLWEEVKDLEDRLVTLEKKK